MGKRWEIGELWGFEQSIFSIYDSQNNNWFFNQQNKDGHQKVKQQTKNDTQIISLDSQFCWEKNGNLSVLNWLIDPSV